MRPNQLPERARPEAVELRHHVARLEADIVGNWDAPCAWCGCPLYPGDPFIAGAYPEDPEDPEDPPAEDGEVFCCRTCARLYYEDKAERKRREG